MRRSLRLFILVQATLLALIGLAIRTLPASADDGPNLLVNGSMEGHFVKQCSRVGGEPWVPVYPCDNNFDPATTFLWETVQVPVGWVAWWRPPNDNQKDPNYFNSFPAYCPDKPDTPITCVPWHNPEFRDTAGGPQETRPSRKVAGDNSQKYCTFYSVHEAGLYQTVGGIQPGQHLRFSVYIEAWSSPFNDPTKSQGQLSMNLRIGIDPYGGNNPWSPNIVWTPVRDSFDHWDLYQVEAVAQSDHVTVFTYSRPVYALQHNDVYLDEASLVVVGPAPQPTRISSGTITVTRRITRTLTPTATLTTRTPFPTGTLRPTATPTITPTPQPTATPTPTPTPTITPTPTPPPIIIVGMAGVNQIYVAGCLLLGALMLGYVVVRVTASDSDEP